MPPQLQRSVTASAVAVGVSGVSSILRGLVDVLSVFPYLFQKVAFMSLAFLQWGASNILQAIGLLVVGGGTLFWIDSVYNVRASIACVLYPALCATARTSDVDLR